MVSCRHIFSSSVIGLLFKINIVKTWFEITNQASVAVIFSSSRTTKRFTVIIKKCIYNISNNF